MNIPPKTKLQWADIVTGKKTYNLKFLAAKILLGRLTRTASGNASKDVVQDCINQLYEVYEKNINTPSVQEDLKTIFG